MVFRRVEYAIEGDRNAQMKLDKQAWDWEKIRKKGLKWFVFFVISFVVSNVFLAYIIGSDQLLVEIKARTTKAPQYLHCAAYLHRSILLCFCLVSRTSMYHCLSLWALAGGTTGQQVHCGGL